MNRGASYLLLVSAQKRNPNTPPNTPVLAHEGTRGEHEMMASAAECTLSKNHQPEPLPPPGPEPTQKLTREAAFADLVHRHVRHLFRVAYSLLRNSADAEDTVQEALLKLFRGEAWRDLTNERAFLAQTVWRVGLDRLRTRSSTQPLDPATEDNLPDLTGNPEQLSSDTEQRANLRRLIHALPPDLRQPLLLSSIDELTSAEIALILAIPEGTVRTRLMRARTELRRRFEATQQTAVQQTRPRHLQKGSSR